MKIVFIGCVDFSHALLEKVLALPDAQGRGTAAGLKTAEVVMLLTEILP
jgi:hypothetical protein